MHAIPLSLSIAFFACMQLVELKNGDTYNGHLVNCDTWMNVNLREVICTSKVRSHPSRAKCSTATCDHGHATISCVHAP